MEGRIIRRWGLQPTLQQRNCWRQRFHSDPAATQPLCAVESAASRAGRSAISEAVLERDYCLSWISIGLSQTRLSEWLAFKGGTALKKIYFRGYRFSEDLDFTLRQDVAWESIEAEWGRLGRWVRDRVGVAADFLERDPASHANTYTFYIGLRGPIPHANPDRLKVDITIRELVCQAVEQRPLLREYEEYTDLEEAQVPAYPIEEIAAEKLMALLTGARNEPRATCTTSGVCRSSDESTGPSWLIVFARKYRLRNGDPGRLIDAYGAKEDRLKRLWSSRLEQQMAVLPPFDRAYRETRRAIMEDLMANVAEQLERLRNWTEGHA